MRNKGFSQDALAREIGVTHSAVSRWITGSMPHPKRLLSLANLLGVSVSFLEFGDSEAIPMTTGNEVRSSDPNQSAPPAEEKIAGGELATLRGQVAEKDRQIERLLGIIERQAAALEARE